MMFSEHRFTKIDVSAAMISQYPMMPPCAHRLPHTHRVFKTEHLTQIQRVRLTHL